MMLLLLVECLHVVDDFGFLKHASQQRAEFKNQSVYPESAEIIVRAGRPGGKRKIALEL